MSSIAGLTDFRKQGPPADIGTFQLSCTVLVFQHTFAGTDYFVAMRSGERGWILVDIDTDFSAVVNNAILFVNGIGGGMVHVAACPLGVPYYELLAAIDLLDYVWLEGEGWNTILRLADNTNTDMIYASGRMGVSISNLQLDGNKAGNVGFDNSQIAFYTVTDSQILNCWLHDGMWHTITLTESSVNCLIAENLIEDGENTGIHIDASNSNIIANNIVKNMGDRSLLTADAAALQPDVTVADGSIFEAGQTVMLSDENLGAAGTAGTPQYEVLTIQNILGNVITMVGNLVNAYTVANNAELREDIAYGIFCIDAELNIVEGNYVEGTAQHGIANDNSDYINVADNIVKGTGSPGIEFAATSHYCSAVGNIVLETFYSGIDVEGASTHNEVIGNVVYGIRGNGIYLHSFSDGTVTGNVISDCLSCGIYVLADGNDRNVIDGNTIMNNGRYGMLLEELEYSTVTGNVIANNGQEDANVYDGIKMDDNSRYNMISSNNIADDQATHTHKYGIQIRSTCTHNLVANNFVLNTRDHGILSNADYTSIKGCYVYGAATSGLYFDGADHSLIVDNYLKANADYQLYLVGSTYCLVDGNMVIDTASWKKAIMLASNSHFGTVTNNYVYNTTTINRIGIEVDGSDDCVIDDNTVTNCAAAGWGIKVVAGCDRTRVFGNRFSGCDTNFIDDGTDTMLPEIQGQIDIGSAAVTIGDGWGVNLPDAADTHVRINWNIPSGLQQLVRCRILVIPLGTGNMAYSVATDFGKRCVEVYTTHTDTKALGTQAVTINEIECIDVDDALTDIVAGDFVLMDFLRDGDDGSDTVAAACVLVGAYMQYV